MRLGDHLGQLASGQPVYDRARSHLHGGIGWQLLQDAFDQIHLDDHVRFVVSQIDFGRQIGFCNVVETTQADTIFYIKRLGRLGISRFVLGRESEPCRSLVVVLKKVEDAEYYILITAYIGVVSEPEPWNPDATPGSKDYWSRHAFIVETEPVDWGTATQQCPW